MRRFVLARHRRDLRRFGLCAGVWAGASAAVVARIGVSATDFGLALTLMTVVYLAAMSVGRRARRSASACAAPCWSSLLAMGPTLALLVAARAAASGSARRCALFGALAGLLDFGMNAEGARVEQRSGKPIFAQFHAIARRRRRRARCSAASSRFGGSAWVAALDRRGRRCSPRPSIVAQADRRAGRRAARLGGVARSAARDRPRPRRARAWRSASRSSARPRRWPGRALLLRHEAPSLAAYRRARRRVLRGVPGGDAVQHRPRCAAPSAIAR